MRSSSTKSCRSDEGSLADRFRREGFLGPQSFESFQRVRGVAWFERGDRPVFPLTRNPTSLGCWRLRFKSGRTHLTSGSIQLSSPIHAFINYLLFSHFQLGDNSPAQGCFRREALRTGTRPRSILVEACREIRSRPIQKLPKQ